MKKNKKESLNILKAVRLKKIAVIDNDIFGTKSNNNTIITNRLNFIGEVEKSIDTHLKKTSPFFYGEKNMEYIAPHFTSILDVNQKKFLNKSVEIKEKKAKNDKKENEANIKVSKLSSSFLDNKQSNNKAVRRSVNLSMDDVKINVNDSQQFDNTCFEIPDKASLEKRSMIKEKINKREYLSRAVSAKIIESKDILIQKKQILEQTGTFYFNKEKREDHFVENAKKKAEFYESIRKNYLNNFESIDVSDKLQLIDEDSSNSKVYFKPTAYAIELNYQTAQKKEIDEMNKLKEMNELSDLKIKNKIKNDKEEAEKQKKKSKLIEETKKTNDQLLLKKRKEIENKKKDELKQGEELVKLDKELKEKELRTKLEKSMKTKKEMYVTLSRQVQEKKKSMIQSKSRSMVKEKNVYFVSVKEKNKREKTGTVDKK